MKGNNFCYKFSSIFQCIDALCDRKVCFGPILFNNKKAASLVKVWVVSNFEVLKILHLFLSAFMELDNILHESLIFVGQGLTIVFKVQNASGFRFNLTNIDINDASNLVLGLSTLDTLLLLGHSCFLILAGNTYLVSSAKAVVITMVIPEIFQIIVF